MADDGTIRCYKTPTGQRRIDIQSIQEFCSTASNVPKEPTLSKKNFIYARVSTKKQVVDLSRQLNFLQQPQYTGYTVITDIALGINFKRKGLDFATCFVDQLFDKFIAKSTEPRFRNFRSSSN